MPNNLVKRSEAPQKHPFLNGDNVSDSAKCSQTLDYSYYRNQVVNMPSGSEAFTHPVSTFFQSHDHASIHLEPSDFSSCAKFNQSSVKHDEMKQHRQLRFLTSSSPSSGFLSENMLNLKNEILNNEINNEEYTKSAVSSMKPSVVLSPSFTSPEQEKIFSSLAEQKEVTEELHEYDGEFNKNDMHSNAKNTVEALNAKNELKDETIERLKKERLELSRWAKRLRSEVVDLTGKKRKPKDKEEIISALRESNELMENKGDKSALKYPLFLDNSIRFNEELIKEEVNEDKDSLMVESLFSETESLCELVDHATRKVREGNENILSHRIKMPWITRDNEHNSKISHDEIKGYNSKFNLEKKKKKVIKEQENHVKGGGDEEENGEVQRDKSSHSRIFYLNKQFWNAKEENALYKKQLNKKNEENEKLKKKLEEVYKALEIIKKDRDIANDKRHEALEKLDDLTADIENINRIKDTEQSAKEQIEEALQDLQERYSCVTHHLQEIDEQRTSYAEGLREKQTQLDNYIALFQIKSEELLKVRCEIKDLNDKNITLEIELREAKDIIKNLEAHLTKVKDELKESNQKNENLKNEINRFIVEEQKKQEKIEKLEISLMDLCFYKNQADIYKKEIKNLNTTLEKLQESYEKKTNNYESTINKLQDIKDDVLLATDEAQVKFADASNEIDKLSSESMAEILKRDEIKHKVRLLQDHFQHQIDDLKIKHQNELDEKETQLETLENEFERVQNELETEIKNYKNKNDNLEKRIKRFNKADGNEKIISAKEEINKMKKGDFLTKACFNSKKHKKVLRFVKLTNDNKIMWTADLTGKTGFKGNKFIKIEDIYRIEFGCYSQAQLWGAKETVDLPWLCFSLYTAKRTYDFICPNDDVTESWVVGLGQLVSPHTSCSIIRSREEYIVARVKMKLKHYCKRQDISPVVMWKRAIAKTLFQLSELHERPKRLYSKRSAEERMKYPEERYKPFLHDEQSKYSKNFIGNDSNFSIPSTMSKSFKKKFTAESQTNKKK